MYKIVCVYTYVHMCEETKGSCGVLSLLSTLCFEAESLTEHGWTFTVG